MINGQTLVPVGNEGKVMVQTRKLIGGKREVIVRPSGKRAVIGQTQEVIGQTQEVIGQT